MTTAAPTTLSTTAAPTTITPAAASRNPDLDITFNCKGNNYAGILFIETYIEGVAASPSYGLADLELAVETYITGSVPNSALYVLDDLELSVVTKIEGQGVTNAQRCNWVGWSKIGQADFTLDAVNDAGYKPMDWPGCVYQVLKLDKNVVVYGSGGVTLAYPVSTPIATFGFKNLYGVGIKNRTAVTGNEFVHYFIDISGYLYKVTTQGIEKLGYKEYLNKLVNPVLLYDNAESRLYISDENTGYIFNDEALTNGYKNLTGLYRIKDDLTGVSPESIIADPVEVVTDVIDFKRRGIKNIESMNLGSDAEVAMYVAVDYRFGKDKDFQTTAWVPINDEGFANIKISGVEFRFRFKGFKYGEINVSYLNVQYKLIDQRFSRDHKYRMGELDVY